MSFKPRKLYFTITQRSKPTIAASGLEDPKCGDALEKPMKRVKDGAQVVTTENLILKS